MTTSSFVSQGLRVRGLQSHDWPLQETVGLWVPAFLQTRPRCCRCTQEGSFIDRTNVHQLLEVSDLFVKCLLRSRKLLSQSTTTLELLLGLLGSIYGITQFG